MILATKQLIAKLGEMILSDHHISRWLILIIDIFIVSVSYFIVLIISGDLSIKALSFSSLIHFIDISFYILMFFQFHTFSSFEVRSPELFFNDDNNSNRIFIVVASSQWPEISSKLKSEGRKEFVHYYCLKGFS